MLFSLVLLLAWSPAQSGTAIEATEMDHLITRAKQRRQEIETFFRRVYEGDSQLCAHIPKPTPTDSLAEDCLQGYNMGYDPLTRDLV